jgi:hypothetical protein
MEINKKCAAQRACSERSRFLARVSELQTTFYMIEARFVKLDQQTAILYMGATGLPVRGVVAFNLPNHLCKILRTIHLV